MALSPHKVQKLLNAAPGPCPWYMHKFAPAVSGCTWGELELEEDKGGSIALFDADGAPLAVFSIYTYCLLVTEHTLLVWNQRAAAQHSPSQPITCIILTIPDLRPLNEAPRDLLEQIGTAHNFVLHQCSSAVVFEIPTDVEPESPQRLTLPEPLQHTKELLFLCKTTGIVKESPYEDNKGIVVANPAKGFYTIYPQEWWNRSDADFGYVWITRIARGRDGHVYGDGIRMGAFRLDKTMKHADKLY